MLLVIMRVTMGNMKEDWFALMDIMCVYYFDGGDKMGALNVNNNNDGNDDDNPKESFL